MSVVRRRRLISPDASFFAAPAPVSGVGFDPATQSTTFTLSNGDLTATKTSGGGGEEGRSVKSRRSHATGKWHVRFTIVEDAGMASFMGVGFCLAAFVTDVGIYLAEDTNGFALYGDAAIYYNTSASGGLDGTFTETHFVDFNIDFDAEVWWGRIDGTGNWNQNPSADPVAGLFGNALPVTLDDQVALFYAVELSDQTMSVTVQTNGTNAASGFTGWDV